MADSFGESLKKRRIGASAFAEIRGDDIATGLHARVYFTHVPYGTEVYDEGNRLPDYQPETNDAPPVGPDEFQIHTHDSCEVADQDDHLQEAGGQWSPDNQPHGHHAGDFPVLFSNDGYARMFFFTNRFRPKDVVGKTVMIHENPDDYRTQPAGDSGTRIGCGVIRAYK